MSTDIELCVNRQRRTGVVLNKGIVEPFLSATTDRRGVLTSNLKFCGCDLTTIMQNIASGKTLNSQYFSLISTEEKRKLLFSSCMPRVSSYCYTTGGVLNADLEHILVMRNVALCNPDKYTSEECKLLEALACFVSVSTLYNEVRALAERAEKNKWVINPTIEMQKGKFVDKNNSLLTQRIMAYLTKPEGKYNCFICDGADEIYNAYMNGVVNARKCDIAFVQGKLRERRLAEIQGNAGYSVGSPNEDDAWQTMQFTYRGNMARIADYNKRFGGVWLNGIPSTLETKIAGSILSGDYREFTPTYAEERTCFYNKLSDCPTEVQKVVPYRSYGVAYHTITYFDDRDNALISKSNHVGKDKAHDYMYSSLVYPLLAARMSKYITDMNAIAKSNDLFGRSELGIYYITPEFFCFYVSDRLMPMLSEYIKATNSKPVEPFNFGTMLLGNYL